MKVLKTKRQIAILIIICMMFGIPALAANVSFKEDTNSNYLKYIGGFEDGTVHPDSVLTRAQGAKMLSYVLSINEESNDSSFSDVSRDFWGYSAISALSGAQIINGYKGGAFKPNQGLTRAEFAAILSRILGLTLSQKITVDFKDIGGHWAAREITALESQGYIGGYSDATFRPDKYLTRAEAVKLINKAVKISPKTNETRELFSDLPQSHWAYYEIMAAASNTPLETTIERGNVKFEDIKYISLDIDALTKKSDSLFEEFDNASVERQAEIYREIKKMEVDISTAKVMTVINAARDVTNEKYENDKLNSAEASNFVLKIKRSMHDKLKECKNTTELGKLINVDIDKLEEPTPPMDQDLINMLTEESNLANEFEDFYYGNSIAYEGKKYSLAQAEASSDEQLARTALSYYEKNYKIYGGIFDRLVKVRTKMANYFQLKNYVELGYYISGKTTYTADDTDIFRSDVKKYIVPLYNEIRNGKGKANSEYQYPVLPEISSKRDILSETMKTLEEMSPQTNQTLKYMTKYNMFDLDPRENKNTGAFTTFINEYMTPFIFMNKKGGYDDLEVFSHEFGHSFQYFRTITKDFEPKLSSDLAEVASYGMECLMSDSYSKLFGNDSAKQLEMLFLLKNLNLIMNTSALDEFQIKVYENPNMTIEGRNSLYAEIDQEYFGKYPSNALEIYKKGIIWSNPAHIFERPFYAIDYALALTTAMQIWDLSKTDFDKGYESYMSVIESEFSSYGIEKVCLTSGLKSPFEKDVLKSISEMISKIFKKTETDTLQPAA